MPLPKDTIQGYMADMFADFLYYNRKEDELFTLREVENLLGTYTKEELGRMLLEEFYKAL